MRIRTIKPEILTDEKTAGLSDTSWRLFVSCIVMADDYGNFRASPAFLHSQVFWANATYPDACAKALETLARLSLVSLYKVAGQQYGHIVGWAKHQRVDHPGKPLCPRENQGTSTSYENSSRESQEDSASIHESLKPDPDRDLDQEGKGKGPTPPDPSCACSGGECLTLTLCDVGKVSAIAKASAADLTKPREKIRPRTAHDLEHCLRVAMQTFRPEACPWLPGRFAAKDADECIRKLGDIEAALPVIERKIELFAKDPDMQPWTVTKFVDKFNAIGLPKLDFGRAPDGKPKKMQARY